MDVDGIKYVINFDYPQSSEDYIHRIGRTGRSETKGTSYAFFTKNNARQSKALVDVLREANQEISPALEQLVRNNRGGFGDNRRFGGGGGSRFGNGGTFKKGTLGGGGGRFGGGNGAGRGGGGGGGYGGGHGGGYGNRENGNSNGRHTRFD